MIASWMLYALLVSVLLAAGAWLLEGAVRLRGGPVRYLWLGALLATVALTALAPLRTAPAALLPSVTLQRTQGAAGTADARPEGPAALAARVLRTARAALARPLSGAAAVGTGAAGTALAGGWMALSAAVLALAAVTVLRARRARRGWPLADVAGAHVRVSPQVGPAVLGIVRPEVVVPAWLLDAPAEEQRLVVLHEREHVRARDPLLLAAGCLAVALVPWSPAAWWMLLRLRAAAELDCDARVLRQGVRPHAYGTLLIEMAGRGPGLSLGAPALAGSPSTLERRLRAMNARLPRFARLRAGLLGTLGLALLASACDTPLPTTAEVEAMDVRALEARTLVLVPTQADGSVTYYVDDRQVTAEEARALTGDRVVRLEATRAQAQGPSVVRIYTKPGAGGEGYAPSVAAVQVTATGNAQAGSTGELQVTATRGAQAGRGDGSTMIVARDANGAELRATRAEGTTLSAGFEGLLVIDGVISNASALGTMDADRIESVEVIKGAAATQVYDDPRAAQGVIRITTKRGANR
jgi:beta-lactamase regulating signal transducer with metallopeptidase domain